VRAGAPEFRIKEIWVPRWPCKIRKIVLVYDSKTITNGVFDCGTGASRFPV
jgi:hypothetical protein